MSGKVIDFERELDFKLRKSVPCEFDLFDVRGQFRYLHAPVVEVVARHRTVVGKAYFFETKLSRARSQIDRLADCMAAERRVHVIVGRQSHRRVLTGTGLCRNSEPRLAAAPTQTDAARNKNIVE